MHYCATMLAGKASQYETTMRVRRMSAHFPQPFSQFPVGAKLLLK
mgnify:FL=1